MWMGGRNNWKSNAYTSLTTFDEFSAFTAEVTLATTPLFGCSTGQIDRSRNMQQVSVHLNGDGPLYFNGMKSLTRKLITLIEFLIAIPSFERLLACMN